MRAALALSLLLAGSAPLLAGCGFTPLYAQPGVSPSLSAIDVITPEGRTGQLLMEALSDQLALDRRVPARFRLNLALDERRYARGLQPEEIATWYEQYASVRYSLVDIATGETMTAGVIPVSVSYDAVRDPYAGIVQQRDGEKRAADEAAVRLRLELSRYFAGRGAVSP